MPRNRETSPFSEALAWSRIQANWKQLYGAFEKMGISFEWHEFTLNQRFDWSRSFHPRGVEVCLNLAGEASVSVPGGEVALTGETAASYWTGSGGLRAERIENQRHEFITVEFSEAFLREHFSLDQPGLHPVLAAALEGSAAPKLSAVCRLSAQHHELIASFRRPPVYRWAQYTWYLGKALEIAALFLFEPPPEEELFCHRQHLLARERVEKVRRILRESLAQPPALEEIARRVGCSPFYLSRTFSKETGITIPQYIRRIRMEKAAELLKSGKFNVTEAALEVGYSSLSHFSQAFHEAFGCCPGLYPLNIPGANGRFGQDTLGNSTTKKRNLR